MRKKKPILAAILGFLVHPLGYFYVGRYWRGLAIFFLVPLILSPFMPESQFLGQNMTVNDTSLENLTLESGLNETGLFDELEETGLFDEVYDTYVNNPWLIFLQVFLSFVISLDCFFIARSINAKAFDVKKEKGKKPLKGSLGLQAPKNGMYFPVGVDVSCPRCKIGLAAVTVKCPNCGAPLKKHPEKKD